jgi:hypothetical protein
VKDGEKSIHDAESIRFMKDIIGAGKWQENVLRHGLSLNFKKEPGKYREKNNMSAVKQMEVLKDKVAEWVKEGHVEKLAEPAWCTNPMSVAAKYDPVKDETKLRLVIDLSRHVNTCVKESHVKLDDLSLAEELIEKGDYMALFDLANQFFHVRLNPTDRKYFGFALPTEDGREVYYRFTVMAYGYSPAVEVVTRLLKPVKAYLHQMGIKLSIFVDDGRVSAASKRETWEKFQFVLTTLQLCGWNIQWKKTSTEAVQSLLHLGFVTDLIQLRYFLPAEKEKVVMDMLQRTIAQGSKGRPVAALELTKLLGKLNSMRRSQGPTLGDLSRTCQHLLGINVLERGWQTTVQLTYEAVRELSFLEDRLVMLSGQHILSSEARTKIFDLSETDRLVSLIKLSDEPMPNHFVSDASDSHAYIYKADGQFQTVKDFKFSKDESTASSGYRELLAVHKTLVSDPWLFKDFAGGSVFWQTDSKNCYNFLSQGSRIPEIQKLSHEHQMQRKEVGRENSPCMDTQKSLKNSAGRLGFQDGIKHR